MIQGAAIAIAAVAFGAWVMAVAAALQMMQYRTPGVSGWWFAINGIAFFTGRNFEQGAEPHRKRLMRWVAVFALALLGAIVLAAIAVPPHRTQA